MMDKKRKKYRTRNEFHSHKKRKLSDDKSSDDSDKALISYYENILKDIKKGMNNALEDEIISNILEESSGKEVKLSCHGVSSHCLEILLKQCKDTLILMRFMSAFQVEKSVVCTNANASHIVEYLMHKAVEALQNWSVVINSEEDEGKQFVTHCINWLEEFGNFALENLSDCLHSPHSCHVLVTLIAALAGDLVGTEELMSKSLKNHKSNFFFGASDENSSKNVKQIPAVLDIIPKSFSDILKSIYKALVQSENLANYINDGSTSVVIEALLITLKKRHPKSCKKLIGKTAKKMFLMKNEDEIPSALIQKNASYVFGEMFKAADEDMQLALWNKYIANHIGQLVIDQIGNFVIQRLYDAIKSKILFEEVCKHTWNLFDSIAEYQNFGIFVSMSSACNRLNAQQALFMENIMKLLGCFEPVERQDLIIPLILGFQKYDWYMASNKYQGLDVCLQGSLVAQATLKFQKPFKVVKSIQNLPPEEIRFLARHTQGCHVLHAYFESTTVGEINKEKLLHHLQPVLVSMACDRNESLTLARIWTLLSLKLKEFIAAELSKHKDTLKSSKSGFSIFYKFQIFCFRKLEEWRKLQLNMSLNKKHHKH